jgi:hypothetical protein
MFHSLIRRSLLVLVLVLGLVLGSSAASASPLNWGTFLAEEGRSVSGFFDGVLTRAFGGPRTLKHGCSISPDGQPLCAPKLGRSLDPNGHSKWPPAITPKLGCSINPDGHTVCAP